MLYRTKSYTTSIKVHAISRLVSANRVAYIGKCR
jgi:hypothetical protein